MGSTSLVTQRWKALSFGLRLSAAHDLNIQTRFVRVSLMGLLIRKGVYCRDPLGELGVGHYHLDERSFATPNNFYI